MVSLHTLFAKMNSNLRSAPSAKTFTICTALSQAKRKQLKAMEQWITVCCLIGRVPDCKVRSTVYLACEITICTHYYMYITAALGKNASNQDTHAEVIDALDKTGSTVIGNSLSIQG